jgi:ubiquinone/menaquinone biosynthesis C-methylase UbiE
MRLLNYLIVIFLLALQSPGMALADKALAGDTAYSFKEPSRDGIGKVYFGREISHVMGHRGARWLERATREREELPDQVVSEMELEPDARVADIGAGTGYFTFRIARVVTQGTVYAVDIQQEMLDIIRMRMDDWSINNVLPVKGKIDNPQLPPNSIDAVLLVDAYHEFSHPYEMMSGIVQALRPGGKLFLIEYRGEDPGVPIKRLHKMTQAQAIKEMRAVGLEWTETKDFLPTQHFMIFTKA